MQKIQFKDINKDLLIEIAGYFTIKERHAIYGRISKIFHEVVKKFIEEDKKKLLNLDQLRDCFQTRILKMKESGTFPFEKNYPPNMSPLDLF